MGFELMLFFSDSLGNLDNLREKTYGESQF